MILLKAIRNWGIGVINTPTLNDPSNYVYYAYNNTGAAEVLQSGIYSSGATAQVNVKLDNFVMNAFYATAISILWSMQDIFIVNISLPLPTGKWPYNMTIYSDIVRVTEGQRAYIYMKTGGKKPEETYPSIDGINDLGSWNLDLLSMAKASGYIQDKHGYNATWDPDTIISKLLSETDISDVLPGTLSPNNLTATLTMCNLDELHSIWPAQEILYDLNCVSSEVSLLRRGFTELF